MPWTVVLAHAEGEEDRAEEIATPLRENGYSVWHRGTVLVGEAFSEEAQKALAEGGPVVLCATVRAMGTGFAKHLVAASRPLDESRVFILKMEKEADVEPIAGDRKVADYWKDPSAALRQLMAALQKRFPGAHSAPQSPINKDRLRRHREFMERLFLERMQTHERLTEQQATAWYRELMIRRRASDSRHQGRPAGADNEIKEGPIADFLVSPGARLLVLGDGGAGKSTSLCKLAADTARRCEHDSQVPVPIYVELARFDAYQGGAFDRLLQMASNASQLGFDREGLAAFWREGAYPVLFLFDGLNEVKPELQQDCVSALKELASRRPHRYVVTSRPGGGPERLAPPGGDFAVYDVLRFGPDQVRVYLEDRGAGGLYDRLGARLKDLARTPFLLMALAQSCAGMPDSQLPANLGQLYRTFIDDFIFARREPSKPNPPTHYDYEAVKKPLLALFSSRMTDAATIYLDWSDATMQEVASRLQKIEEANRRIRRVMPEDWRVDDLLAELERNGVLHRIGHGLTFSHQSIQEYFTAVADLAAGGDELAAKVPRLLWRNVIPSWDYPPRASAHPRWTTTVMLAGLLGDAANLVRRLRARHPVLAAECLQAAAVVSPELRAELCRSWLSLLESPQPARRWVGCFCLGAAKIGSREAIERLVDLAADTKRDWEKRRQYQHHIARAAADALAEIGSQAALRALLDRALKVAEDENRMGYEGVALPRGNSPFIRLLIAEWRAAISGSRKRHQVETLLGDLGRRQIRHELHVMAREAHEKGDRDLHNALAEAIRAYPSWKGAGIPTPDDVWERFESARRQRRLELESETARLATAPATQLLEMLEAVRWQDRQAAAAVIATRPGMEVLEKLIDAFIREPSGDVATALGEAIRHQGAGGVALRALQRRLRHGDPVRLFAVDETMRSSLEQAEVSEQLRQTFQTYGIDLDHSLNVVMKGGIWQIHEWNRNRVAPRYEIRDDQGQLNVYMANPRVRLADALSFLDPSENIPVLEGLLEDRDPEVKSVAIGALSKREPLPPVLLSRFIRALEDSCGEVRATAAEALGVSGETSAAAALADLLGRETDPSAIEKTIEALRRMHTDIAVDALTDALFLLQPQDTSGDSLLRIESSELEGRDSDEGWGVDKSPGWASDIHDALESQRARRRVLERMKAELVSRDEKRRLIAAREIQRWMRSATIQGRGSDEDEPLFKRLIDTALTDPILDIRKAAALALRWSRATTIIPAIASELQADLPERSVSAAVILGWLGDEAAVDALRIAHRDGDPILRVFSGLALAQIGIEGEMPQDAATIIAAAALTELDDATLRLVDAALDEIPDAPDALYAPVLAALERGEYEAALQLLEQRFRVRAHYGYHFWLRGQTLLGLERLEEALVDFRQASDLMHYWPMPRLDAARVLERLHRLQEALEEADNAVRLSPEDADCQEFLGCLAYRAGEYALAAQSFARSLEIDPTRLGARFNLGIALLASDDAAGAAKAYTKALAIARQEPQNHASDMIAETCSDLEDLARLRPDLQGAVKSVLKLFTPIS